jgi:dTDP-4-dehydrorhamnose 3,5-epimerase
MDKIEILSGILLTPLKKINHPLGDVYHGMKKSDNGFEGFQEVYFSTVKNQIIKPWKKHLRMTLNLIVLVGEIRFVIFDDRNDSPTKDKFMDVSLSLNNYYRLTIPPKVWLAFQGKGSSTNLLINIANIEHDPTEVVREELDRFNFQWS